MCGLCKRVCVCCVMYCAVLYNPLLVLFCVYVCRVFFVCVVCVIYCAMSNGLFLLCVCVCVFSQLCCCVLRALLCDSEWLVFVSLCLCGLGV